MICRPVQWAQRLAVMALALIVLVQHAITGAVPVGVLCVYADGSVCIEAIAGTCCEPPAVPLDCIDCDSFEDDAEEQLVAAEAEAQCDCNDVVHHLVPMHPSVFMAPPAAPILTVIDVLPWRSRATPICARTEAPSPATMSLACLNTVVLRC